MSVLTFRSVDLQASGIKLHLVQGFLMPPAVRGVDYVVPRATGRISASRVADTLSIVLEGHVKADTPENWRAATDNLIAVLGEAGEVPGELAVAAPYMGLSTGASATINARVKNYVQGPIFALTFQAWSIELESVDPYWSLTPAP